MFTFTFSHRQKLSDNTTHNELSMNWLNAIITSLDIYTTKVESLIFREILHGIGMRSSLSLMIGHIVLKRKAL